MNLKLFYTPNLEILLILKLSIALTTLFNIDTDIENIIINVREYKNQRGFFKG
jgi:hypothetical protein